MILVTGATGLVGTYLLYELTSRGQKVRAMIRPGHNSDHKTSLFKCIDPDAQRLYTLIEWVEGDIVDIPSLEMAMKGVTQVYHCAAKISFHPKDRKLMLLNNVQGTANVVNACLRNHVKKLVHVSSIAALGHTIENVLNDEEINWKTSRKNSGYAISKFGAEREVWRGIEEGLNAVIVNPTIILGAGCNPGAVNPIFDPLRKFSLFYVKGEAGYVDIRDVAKAMILLMESDVSGERFLLTAENLTHRQFFSMAAEILGKPKPWIPVSRPILGALWIEEKLRSAITGSTPVITRENARAALRKSKYSGEKFRQRFNFEYTPVRESLAYSFRILGWKN